MKKLNLLIKLRLQALFMSFSKTNGKKFTLGKKLLYGFLAIYLFGAVALMFGGMTAMIISELKAVGLEWLGLAMGAITSITLCFITTIFTMQSQIFGAKDNDLLISMPIKPSVITASRVLSLLMLEYLYNAAVLIPTMVVFAIMIKPAFYFYPMFIIGSLLLPILPLALAGFAAYLFTIISKKMRFKKLIGAVISFGFFGLYFYACFNLQKYILLIVSNGADIASAIKKAVPPVYHFANMASTGSLWSLIVVLLWCVLPITLFLLLMSRGMLKYSGTAIGERAEYKKRPMKQSKPIVAVWKKEWARLTGSYTYLFNTGFGCIFTIGFSIYIAIKGKAALGAFAEIPQIMSFIPQVILVIFGFMIAMTCTTSPSISLEGKSIWILRSAPIKAIDIFKGKIVLQMSMTIPTILVSTLIVVFPLNLTFADALAIAVVPSLLSLFVALGGLYANLVFPKMDSQSDAHAVKQSAAVMISSFGGMGILVVPALLYGFILSKFMSFNIFIACVAAILIVASAIMWALIKSDGVRRFEEL